MKKIFLILCCFTAAATTVVAQKSTKPVAVIFDSDMGPDYDDVGAIAMLHAFADKGEAKILATVASTKYANVAAVFSVFNTYFNRPNIPIAVPKKEALELRDFQFWSDSVVANYPHAVKSNQEVPDAVTLYRKVLAAQPDHSVTIITVGFLTNLAVLLKSPPDEFSKLSGKELVKQKVVKLVSMAGKFPAGKEFNIDQDFPAAKYVYEQWETPVIFSGFEIGEKIKCGLPVVHNAAIKNSPVKDVFRISIPLAAEDKAGRMSWDETAVLVGVKGHEPYYTLQRGKIVIDDKDGSNTWVDDDKSNQYYLKESRRPLEVQQVIDGLIMHQPGKKE